MTREALIDLHRLIYGNEASVASNLGGGRNTHLAPTMTANEYMEQTGYTFVPQQNPGNYPPTMGTSQEQALGTERFRQNQALFRRCTTVDGDLKRQIIMAAQPVFLLSLVDQLTGLGQISTIALCYIIFLPPTGKYTNQPQGKRGKNDEAL